MQEEEVYAAKDILYGTPTGFADFDGSGNPGPARELFIIGIANKPWYHVINEW